jgi:hypothetical protein
MLEKGVRAAVRLGRGFCVIFCSAEISAVLDPDMHGSALINALPKY